MFKVETKHVMMGVSLTFLTMYVGLYLVMSRRAYAEADQDQLNGFYYFTPENSKDWRFHERLVGRIFWPLNFVDRLLGTGRSQGAAPLWDLR